MKRTSKSKQKKPYNLCEYDLMSDGNYSDKFRDNSVYSGKKGTQVFFRNISDHLVKEIKKADIVLGCIAWLTCPKILEALSEKIAVSIIVQKEDFLRPDCNDGIKYLKKWKETLRKRYDSLNGNLDRLTFNNILNRTSVCSLKLIEPVRCVGNYNRTKRLAFPRMHNKFLIFAKYEDRNLQNSDVYNIGLVNIKPYAVWTGSFNLTTTAGKSLENALLIKNIDIVKAYYQEYGQICAMSEPLDWETDWVGPEWRIGT